MTALSWLTLLAWQDFDKTEMSLRPNRGLLIYFRGRAWPAIKALAS
jgi:hypothetical protein